MNIMAQLCQYGYQFESNSAYGAAVLWTGDDGRAGGAEGGVVPRRID